MRFRDLRYPGDTELTVTHGRGAGRARLINVSHTGARLSGLGRLTPDAPVTLTHLNARHLARVVWSNDRLTGVRFVTPLTAAELGALRREGGRGGAGSARPSAGAGGFRELT